MTMKKLFALLIMLAAFCGLKAAEGRPHVLKVGNFTALEVINDLNVACRFNPDSAGMVRFVCPEEIVDAVLFEIRGNKLKVMISPDFIDKTEDLPSITVYADMLESVRSESARRVLVDSPAKCPSFKAILVGNGKLDIRNLNTPRFIGTLGTGSGALTVNGTGGDTLLKLVGAGAILSHELESTKVTCHLLGGGKILCNPIDELVIKGMGSTKVYYRKKPGKIKNHGLASAPMPIDSTTDQ